MDKDQINQLKKNREMLSCNLSSLRREVQKNELKQEQLEKKLARGLKLSEKYQEITKQLIEIGCKYKANSPYLDPEWWRNYNIQTPTSNYIFKDEPPVITPIATQQPIQQQDIINTIKDTVADTIKTIFEQQSYSIHVAWTDDVGDKAIRSELLSIINEYLSELGIKKIRQEQSLQEFEIIYTYMGSEIDIIKKTLEFIIDKWGINSNVDFFCKKIAF